MGPVEMKEIAAVLKLILAHTKAELGTGDGQPASKAKFTLDAAAKAEASERLSALLTRFPVYPELDLPFLADRFL